MVEYSKVNVKLLDSQLIKLKYAVTNQTGVTLRINIYIFEGNNLHHELLLRARQKTKPRNGFDVNYDIKLSKSQVSKTIQPDDFLGALSSKTAGPLAKKIFHLH